MHTTSIMGARRALPVLLLLACLPAHADKCVPQDLWTLHTNDGIGLQVVELGQARVGQAPVIVLHGGPGGDLAGLLDLVQPLASEQQIVLFDQRGSLRSPAPADAIGFDAMVEDIEALRSDLGADRVVLLAHSMGSLLAYGYAQKHPDRVEKLLLVAPMWPASGANAVGAADIYRVLQLPEPSASAQQATQKRKQEQVQSAIARVLEREHLPGETPNARASSHVDRIHYAAWSIHDLSRWRQVSHDADVYKNQIVYPRWIASVGGSAAFEVRRAAFLGGLQHLQKPVTFIVGDQDLSTEPSLWPLLAARIPQATLVRIAGAGHMPWIDDPAQVQQVLRDALIGAR